MEDSSVKGPPAGSDGITCSKCAESVAKTCEYLFDCDQCEHGVASGKSLVINSMTRTLAEECGVCGATGVEICQCNDDEGCPSCDGAGSHTCYVCMGTGSVPVKSDTRAEMDYIKIAEKVLSAAVSVPRGTVILGYVTVTDIAMLAARLIPQCPLCGSEAWVNIDCRLCATGSGLVRDGQ